MPSKRVLVLGSMPHDASPQSHIAAGPWCFAGQEDRFPDWEYAYQFAPEPLASSALPPLAARAAQALCARAIPAVAGTLSENSGSFPPVYWQTLLGPWAIDVARQIIERGLRCAAMREAFGQERLVTPVLPREHAFNFENEHDFTLRGALGIQFNHWLFSRLLENAWPQAWEMPVLDSPRPENGGCCSAAGRAGIFQAARRMAASLQLNLPFPRLKGMNVRQALRFSLALTHKCRQPDHSRDFSSFIKKADLGIIPPLAEVLPIFLAALPASIKKLRHSPASCNRGIFGPRQRVASVAAYENAAYRQKLATWRARGNRLAFVQHGGNYGQVKVACDTELVEYSQAAFFTWGWQKHGHASGNFIPLPCPQLAAIANKGHCQKNGGLLFVGTEMAAFGYRLDSRPTPLQFVQYRKAKELFFKALGSDLLKSAVYRPYFPLPGTLTDAEWLLERFPGLGLCRGPLLPRMLQCRLLVLDHHGTTMLEALAANVPVLLYWNRAHWQLTKECETLLDVLHSCGIWHETPQKAARKAREVWDDPASWWQSREIQRARLAYCSRHANFAPEDINAKWINVLREL